MKTLHWNFILGLGGEPSEMLVEGGRVVRVSPQGPAPEAEDLVLEDHFGETLIPSFVDAHCHILPMGLDLHKLHLGSTRRHSEVLDLVRDWHREHPEGWLLAVHYDHNRYPEGHLSRAQLDQISPDRPILLRHSSGHAGLANSAALRAANVTEAVEDPQGGAYVRDESGSLSGLLLELAFEHVSLAIPPPTLPVMVEAILAAGRSMRALGICCAADMMTGYFDLPTELRAYRLAAEKGCEVATRLYLQWGKVFGRRALEDEFLKGLLSEEGDLDPSPNSCRVAGIKIFADGAIGSRTAAIYGEYEGGQTGATTSGTLIYTRERLSSMILTAAQSGYQVCVHSIGDYATDLVLEAFQKTDRPSMHRIEHAMLLSDAQIRNMADVGCYASFQPEFLVHFGASYLKNLGQQRASMLNRSRSVIDAGINLSFSSDRPIVAGDPWTGIKSACHRPEGFDPSENCTFGEALNAYTGEGAKVLTDAGVFGVLKPGSWAEFQAIQSLPQSMNLAESVRDH